MSNSENKEVFINFCESSSLAYGYTTLLERFATKYDIEEAAAINAIIELNSNGDTLHFMHSYGSAIAEVFQAQAEYTGFDNAITHIVKILKNKEVEVSEADVMNVLFGENYTDINQQIAGVLFVELQNELKVQLNHWTTDNHDGLCSKRIAYKEYVALLSGRRPIVYSGDMQKEDHLSIGTVRAITKLADGVGI